METNYIGCLIAFSISLLLSRIESLEKREITVITCIGWAVYILFYKGGV